MIIRMLVGLSGPTLTLDPGDEHDFPQAEALRLIEAGSAVPISESQIERTMVDEAPERRARGAKRKPD
jgi:hypothetical protein